jgi:hypothetical protein
MAGFCRQNSLENPPPWQDANVWNPSFLLEDEGMREPKYANSITAKTRAESVNLNFMFATMCVFCVAFLYNVWTN